jgi:glutamate/tyrosine decarboxylase-like PLP-dependent enzyme
MSSLALSPEEFHRLAEQVSRRAATWLAELDRLPIMPPVTGAASEALFAEPLPEQGLGEAALEALDAVFLATRVGNGRFLGYVLGSGEPVAALGDLLASVMNPNVTAWRSSPSAVSLELALVRELARALGLPGFRGSFTGGGSSANLMGLAMAREAVAPANEEGAPSGVVYASEQAHMSMHKAVALLGLGRRNLRSIPTDADFRMRPDALAQALEEDAAAGRKAIAVVATAGTVNTGAVDPLPELSALAKRHGAWLHVDGAYGALAALALPERFEGLALADSVSLDAHKWLYQPVDCGLLLYREREAARRAFSFTGDYARVLADDENAVEGFAFFEESLELSRRFRALKLWLSLRYHGLAAFREAIRRDCAHAQRLASRVNAMLSLELLAPVPLSAVCFRFVGGVPPARLDAFNAALLKRVNARGRVYLSNATVRGRFALRACFVNHRTTDADVDAVVDEVLRAASEEAAQGDVSA